MTTPVPWALPPGNAREPSRGDGDPVYTVGRGHAASVRRPRISSLVAGLPPSGIREFFDIVATMDDVISLGVGEPDFATPWHICDEVYFALRSGETSYTSNWGLLELRQEIAAALERDYGAQYDPQRQVIITVGVSEGLDLALRTVLEPGDEVLVPEPCFVAYPAAVLLAHGKPVTVPTTAAGGFKVTPDLLEARLTERTRALILGNPNNPTGTVLSRSELGALAEFAERHDLLVLADEIYDRLVYAEPHTCFATLPGMAERTLLLNGFSKAYAMTGWRIGYVCGPPDIIAAMMCVHSYTMMCAPTVSQRAAVEALRHGRKEMERMVDSYNQRRRLFLSGLQRLGLPCVEPQGAFYAFPSIAHTGLSSAECATRLVHEQRLAAVPGTAFGASGEGHLRCAYCSSPEALHEALRRLEAFLRTV